MHGRAGVPVAHRSTCTQTHRLSCVWPQATLIGLPHGPYSVAGYRFSRTYSSIVSYLLWYFQVPFRTVSIPVSGTTLALYGALSSSRARQIIFTEVVLRKVMAIMMSFTGGRCVIAGGYALHRYINSQTWDMYDAHPAAWTPGDIDIFYDADAGLSANLLETLRLAMGRVAMELLFTIYRAARDDPSACSGTVGVVWTSSNTSPYSGMEAGASTRSEVQDADHLGANDAGTTSQRYDEEGVAICDRGSVLKMVGLLQVSLMRLFEISERDVQKGGTGCAPPRARAAHRGMRCHEVTRTDTRAPHDSTPADI
jgi:hypothetical protein